MRAPSLRWVKHTSLAIGIATSLILGWAGYLRFTGNFHAIEEGVIYRSGQMTGQQFSEKIRAKRIRTVINFRGNNAGQRWYDDEVQASGATGARHIDFPVSANKEWTDDQVSRLTALLRDSPGPLLIHCEAGADRSGLASAIYQLLVAKRSVAEAASQLSFRYGHFPWFRSSTAAMDRTFDRVSQRSTRQNTD